MVRRIHAEISCPECLSRAAPWRQAYSMSSTVPPTIGPMLNSARPLGRNVLIECSSHRHVDQLNPAADTQNRKSAFAGCGKEGQLKQVALAARRTQPLRS